MEETATMQVLKAGTLYFALVFGVGFALGTIRTAGALSESVLGAFALSVTLLGLGVLPCSPKFQSVVCLVSKGEPRQHADTHGCTADRC